MGARAGVSRGAPYRHFPDKESLLTEVAAESWQRLGDLVHALRTNPSLGPADTLRAALTGILAVSRDRPHVYHLMFSAPTGDPAAVVRAAQRMCDEFLAIVAGVVGEDDAQRCSAILLTGVHGAAGLERSGLLRTDKWQTSADELVDALVGMVMPTDR